MKTYNYKSKNNQGKIVTGTLEAETEMEAVSELRRRGLTVISLNAGKGSATKAATSMFSGKNRSASRGRGKLPSGRVKNMELVVFTRQLATMVSAGIPLVESIEVLEEQSSNRVFKAVLEAVIADVRAGSDLSQSLANHPKIFKAIYVNMVRAGEASGQLDITLARLAEYQEKAEALKSEIKAAMTYPVISMALVMGITIFLLVFIIPKFKEMFASMDAELPWITSALLSFSELVQSTFVWWVLGTIMAVVAIVLYFRTDKGELVKDWITLHIPVFGGLFSKVAISRFTRTFSTLIQSGVPILGALEIVEATAGNRLYANGIATAAESVRQGETLGEPLARTKLFPPMVTRMVSIGERTGALEALLEKIADFYDQEVSTTVKSLTSLIEPMLIAVMGCLVGGMVMAIFLPIFKLIGNINSH